MNTPIVRAAALADLDPVTLYRLLQLRVEVFVAEQRCPYPDLDGRDLEPHTRHLWIEPSGEPAAYLRVLREPNGAARIGRVVTAPAARGNGLAATLVRAAVAMYDGDTIVLDAQSHLTDWYGRFGFTVAGPEYLDDDIPHTPMRREAGRRDGAAAPAC